MDLGVIGALTNFGALGVVIILILTGLLVPKPYFAKLEEENHLLKEQAALDRQRADEASEAGRVTGRLISALTDIAVENRAHRTAEPAIAGGDTEPSGSGGGLGWEDTS